MRSFLRSFLPLMLVVVLGLAAAPAHTVTAEHLTHAGHALHDDGHCASHHSHGHATTAECPQGGHSLSLSLCAAGLARNASRAGTWHAAHDESAKPASSEVSPPPPRSS